MNINGIEFNYEVVKPKKLRIKIDIRVIENIVCSFFRINQEELFQRNRKRDIVEKRQIFHYLCTRYTLESLSIIGKYGGSNYGHAVVINSRKQVENLIDTDRRIRQIIQDLELELRKEQVIFLDKDDFRTIRYNLSKNIVNCSSYLEVQSILIKYMVNNN